jgi:hypothetical protein
MTSTTEQSTVPVRLVLSPLLSANGQTFRRVCKNSKEITSGAMVSPVAPKMFALLVLKIVQGQESLQRKKWAHIQ